MSRSRRHTPVIPITCAESEADDKREAHQRERTLVRSAMARGDWEGEPMPHRRQAGDPWKWAKDGRQWFPEAKALRK